MKTFIVQSAGIGRLVICLTILISQLGITSCREKDKGKHSQKTPESVMDQFVRIKYDGKFRNDSIFEKFTHSLNEYRQKNMADTTKALAIQIELNLLRGKQDEAKKMLDIVGKNENYQWLLAYYYANEKEYPKSTEILNGILAEEALTQSLALKANWLMGSIYEEQKMDSIAVNFYKKAKLIGATRNEADYYLESIFHLGNLMYSADKILEAEKEYEEALKQSLEYGVNRLVPFGYYHLGKVKARNGQNEEARAKYVAGLRHLKKMNENDHFIKGLLENKISDLGDEEQND